MSHIQPLKQWLKGNSIVSIYLGFANAHEPKV